MRIVVLEGIPEDPELRRAWNELAFAMERPEVFYTYEWAVAVQRAYEKSLMPLVLLAYDGDVMVGLVALALEKGKTAVRQVNFLAGNTADYCDFLARPDSRHEFVRAAFSELEKRGIEKIVLSNLPADSCSVAAISDASSRCRYYQHLRSAYLCTRVVLGSTEQRTSLKQSVSTTGRLRRNMRALEKRGPVCIRHETHWEQIEPILQSFNRAHVARFLSTGRISNLIGAERRIFLHQLARELSRSGWMALSRFLVGEDEIAWNYGFQFAGSWFWYQPTISGNHAYAAFSPGYCLLSNIVEGACDRPEINLVDLGLGAEEYKERFATANRETLYCVLNRSVFGHFKAVVRDRAAAIAKASPSIEKWIRAMISGVAWLKARVRHAGLWGLLKWFSKRVWSWIFAFEEVLFFEWTAEDQDSDTSTPLVPLDFDLLGAAAIQYADDPAILQYLMRCARRFREERDHGFALLTAQGVPVHFCWVKNYEGFEMAELNRSLTAPSKDAVMIFDCFTPPSERGRGYFAKTIEALAVRLHSQGKAPWIFGAARNRASLLGIEKSGFAYRFSLGSKRILFLNRVKDSIPSPMTGTLRNPVPAP